MCGIAGIVTQSAAVNSELFNKSSHSKKQSKKSSKKSSGKSGKSSKSSSLKRVNAFSGQLLQNSTLDD